MWDWRRVCMCVCVHCILGALSNILWMRQLQTAFALRLFLVFPAFLVTYLPKCALRCILHPHFSSSYPARLFIATLIKIQMGAYATLCVLLIFTLYPNEIECGQSCCMMGSPTTLATPYLMLLPVSVCVSFALRQTESLLHILADNTRCCILPNIKDNFPKYIFEVRSNYLKTICCIVGFNLKRILSFCKMIYN